MTESLVKNDTFSSAISHAVNYNNWVVDLFSPYLDQKVLDVGIGCYVNKFKKYNSLENAIKETIDEIKKGFDMVVGERTGNHYHESLIKSPLRKILRFLVEFAANREIPDDETKHF